MSGSGEEQRETIRPEFDRSIKIDFQGAKITSDTGFLLLREIDERFGILDPIENGLEDGRSWVHSNQRRASDGPFRESIGWQPGMRTATMLTFHELIPLFGSPFQPIAVLKRLIDLRYRTQTRDRERRVVAKTEWHDGELFTRIVFIVTISGSLLRRGTRWRRIYLTE